MARLAVVQDRHILRELDVGAALVTIGGGPAQEVRLEGASVAAKHCYLKREGGGYVLHAVAGASTTVNGSVVRRATLQPGDEIGVGEFLLLFEPLPQQYALLDAS